MGTSVLSVGIDIGTATTSMIVSRLGFSNTAASWNVPRVDITEKEILYKSGLYFTPMTEGNRLDGKAIRELIAAEYRSAGIQPELVDSGAVIITGESAMKENADAVSAELSDFAGEFVVATAGPLLEALIAGRGAGAEEYSKEHSCTAVNLDIGGGTTNIAVFSCGEPVLQSCLAVGGRLIRYDKNGTIFYVSSELAPRIEKNMGFAVTPGMTVTPKRMKRVADLMAGELSWALAAMPEVPQGSVLSFSGGVGDCFYTGEGDLYRYGDLGVSLAASLRESPLAVNYKVIPPKETIRATVVGAGIYTTEVSGSTITYSGELFPLKNIPAFSVGENAERMAYLGDARGLLEQLRWFVGETGRSRVIFCLKGKKKASYPELCRMAQSIAEAAEEVLPPGEPLLVITENDMAKSLGQTILRGVKGRREVACIDRVRLEQGDYVDIGKPLMDGLAVPVVVKTLIFR